MLCCQVAQRALVHRPFGGERQKVIVIAECLMSMAESREESTPFVPRSAAKA
jgi:hypothetical protein